ncbi:hypothetical protein LCGC14_2917780 [marine sediment metagenome]|uniref:Uncharacterized protein n=1 Tax=marine sediment metagenome TaxID=412755 RepID=A0A0F9AFQ6_9ZZZZ
MTADQEDALFDAVEAMEAAADAAADGDEIIQVRGGQAKSIPLGFFPCSPLGGAPLHRWSCSAEAFYVLGSYTVANENVIGAGGAFTSDCLSTAQLDVFRLRAVSDFRQQLPDRRPLYLAGDGLLHLGAEAGDACRLRYGYVSLAAAACTCESTS